MALLESLPTAVLAGTILCLSWVILRPLLTPSSLDNLPGPPAESWFIGEYRVGHLRTLITKSSHTTGNLRQFFALNPWEFREELARKYPRVSALHAPFGYKWVHVWDPKAFHAMFVKDQDVFEEPLL